MARRRYQDPKPFRRGRWWYVRYWQDEFTAGKYTRTRAWKRLAPIGMSDREVRKIASDMLRPMNQGLEMAGGATNFRHYIDSTYRPTVMPLLAQSTKNRSEGVIKNYLLPTFANHCLRDLTALTLQTYFSGLASSVLAHESRDKIRDVLASILASAVQYGFLVKNPADGLRLPPERRGRRRSKPYVTPAQFAQLIETIAEPYATMIHLAIWTGLRISEVCALRWNDIHEDSITIDERFCRGDWGAPKSDASNATIPVNRSVIERIHRLKLLTIEVRAGRAKRRYQLVKKSGPNDLVFQSVRKGAPMRDNNILCRFLKPAARKLGLDFVNWRCLRTSHATWLKMAGADVKDAQAQLRHSRASTTLDVYQQFVPESQQRAIEKLGRLVQ